MIIDLSHLYGKSKDELIELIVTQREALDILEERLYLEMNMSLWQRFKRWMNYTE